MNRRENARSESRGDTVLVISLSSVFVEIVGRMLIEGGFEPATAMPAEPAWRSVARTRPTLVICDGNSPDEMVGQLIPETIVRRLPLLMLGMTDRQKSARAGSMPTAGITWLQFPLARDAFQSAIDELLTPLASVSRHITLAGAGATMDAGFVVRSLDDVSRR
jgi:DNA-binding NtrC family response regulator